MFFLDQDGKRCVLRKGVYTFAAVCAWFAPCCLLTSYQQKHTMLAELSRRETTTKLSAAAAAVDGSWSPSSMLALWDLLIAQNQAVSARSLVIPAKMAGTCIKIIQNTSWGFHKVSTVHGYWAECEANSIFNFQKSRTITQLKELVVLDSKDAEQSLEFANETIEFIKIVPRSIFARSLLLNGRGRSRDGWSCKSSLRFLWLNVIISATCAGLWRLQEDLPPSSAMRERIWLWGIFYAFIEIRNVCLVAGVLAANTAEWQIRNFKNNLNLKMWGASDIPYTNVKIPANLPLWCRTDGCS